MDYLQLFNNSKVAAGISMLLLNCGSRYIVGDLGKFHQDVLSNEYVKKIILFAMFFVGTRDILIAFLLTVLYIFVVDGLFNEKKKYCIIPNKYKKKYLQQQVLIDNTQYLQAKEIINNYEKQKQVLEEEQQQKIISENNNNNSIIEKYSDEYDKYTYKIKMLNNYT